MARKEVFTEDDDALLSELGLEADEDSSGGLTPLQERILAGFEEIQRFTEEQGRPPQHGQGRDIFERLYAVRLDRIRADGEMRALVEGLDHQGLLAGGESAVGAGSADIDDDALLSELGPEAQEPPLMALRHVRSTAEKQAAEEIASRERCADFHRFKPLFERVQKELASGIRQTRPFERKAEITQGRFFILGGQKAYIAEVGAIFKQDYGDNDARLRVIFDNGTESNMLMRSLQRALHKDEAGRRITEPGAGPLFADQTTDEDASSGTIYVLRSASALPLVAQRREVLHKIGVTSGKIEQRIANARLDPTFLMADVEIMATYELYNINRSKLENLIHRIFGPARLEIEVKDRFGNPITPREWFLVPLFVIDEAVEKIRDGSITQYVYDPQTARLELVAR